MLDAIQTAFLSIRRAHNTRRALVLISDGGDNHSRAAKTKNGRMARESDAQVYALGTFEPSSARRRPAEEATGPELLAQIRNNREAGVFRLSTLGHQGRRDSNWAGTAGQVSDRLRPVNQTWNGLYRRITVEVARPPDFRLCGSTGGKATMRHSHPRPADVLIYNWLSSRPVKKYFSSWPRSPAHRNHGSRCVQCWRRKAYGPCLRRRWPGWSRP